MAKRIEVGVGHLGIGLVGVFKANFASESWENGNLEVEKEKRLNKRIKFDISKQLN